MMPHSPVPKATPGVRMMFVAAGSVGSLQSGMMYKPSATCAGRQTCTPQCLASNGGIAAA
jgi:hypothetical protein